MTYEQQIRQYEEKIAHLEKCQRLGGHNQGQVSRSLDETYEQFVLLKIRKMMGF
jgi:hypothetical protein